MRIADNPNHRQLFAVEFIELLQSVLARPEPPRRGLAHNGHILLACLKSPSAPQWDRHGLEELRPHVVQVNVEFTAIDSFTGMETNVIPQGLQPNRGNGFHARQLLQAFFEIVRVLERRRR
jgi:hypothetical protein